MLVRSEARRNIWGGIPEGPADGLWLLHIFFLSKVILRLDLILHILHMRDTLSQTVRNVTV